MSENKKLLIIGGGVIGLCSAYFARLRGMSVTVLERDEFVVGNCSMGNAGMIVPSHFIPLAAPGMISKGIKMMFDSRSPFYIRPQLSPSLAKWIWEFLMHANEANVTAHRKSLLDWNMQSRQLFKEMMNSFPENERKLQEKGLLMLCNTEHGLEEEAAMVKMAHELGARAELLNAAQVQALEPHMTMDIAGAVYFPDDCHLNPSAFMKSLHATLQAMGVELLANKNMTAFVQEQGKVKAVACDREKFSADEFLISTGAWSADLLKMLHVNLPLQAGKGYSVTLPDPPDLPQICSILCEAKVAVTPMQNQLRIAGTMEVGGVPNVINHRRVSGIISSIEKYFPKIKTQLLENLPVWSGQRPVSPDGIPYVGKLRRYPNVTVATGHAMMGLSLAPITGKVVAELAEKGSSPLATPAFHPERFCR